MCLTPALSLGFLGYMPFSYVETAYLYATESSECKVDLFLTLDVGASDGIGEHRN